MTRRRTASALTIALTLLWWSAAPAAADPPGPTNYRSEVRDIDPDVDGVEVRVVGGDSFLQLTVEPGHEVVVLGYEDEPYLRFDADGIVEENQRSPATFLNRDRMGGEAAPPTADADAEPEWRGVADDGRWAWHDHRIHWMGSEPPVVDAEGRVTKDGPEGWSVPLEVDGTAVVVRGDLILTESVSPLPTGVAVLVAAGLVVALGRRRPLPAAGLAVITAALATLVLGWAEWSAAPPGGAASPVLLVLPAMALVAAIAGFLLPSTTARGILVITAAAALGAWTMSRLGIVTNRVLPTALDPWIDRLGTGAAVGAALAAVVLVVRSGALAAPAGDPGPATAGPDATLAP